MGDGDDDGDKSSSVWIPSSEMILLRVKLTEELSQGEGTTGT